MPSLPAGTHKPHTVSPASAGLFCPYLSSVPSFSCGINLACRNIASSTCPVAAPPKTDASVSASAPQKSDGAAAAFPKTETAETAPTTESKGAPAASADKTPAAGSALPTIWELPYSVRKDLPAIDLSMHVYSADPKQRFVVLKGDRHTEGDEVGQDLVLKEIRQDGVVLDYKGQRFFFPRTGR